MTRRNSGGWYPSAPKKPPPRRGIKMKQAGTTWWGARWIEALERMSVYYQNRLARGRTYARAGRTHDLVVRAGEVTARVTGSRASPYRVRIALASLADPVWAEAIAQMGARARFAAELLAGRMPEEIDSVFAAAGGSLFPAAEADLETRCSCPDWANPCKHVAATHYVLGEALDRDPFLLFELRGRTRDQVLAALRAVRGGEVEAGRCKTASRTPVVSLGRMTADDYHRSRASWPELGLSFDPPPEPGALLGQLGTPAAWTEAASPVDLLGPEIRAASDEARWLAVMPSAPEFPADGESEEAGPAGGSVGTGATRADRTSAVADKKAAAKKKAAAAKKSAAAKKKAAAAKKSAAANKKSAAAKKKAATARGKPGKPSRRGGRPISE